MHKRTGANEQSMFLLNVTIPLLPPALIAFTINSRLSDLHLTPTNLRPARTLLAALATARSAVSPFIRSLAPRFVPTAV